MATSQTFAWLVAAMIVAGGVGAYVRRHDPPDQTPPPGTAQRITDVSNGQLQTATMIQPASEPPVEISMASDTTDLLRPVDDVERLLDELDADLGGEATPVDRAALAEVLDSTATGD